jgi:hypothetical protein
VIVPATIRFEGWCAVRLSVPDDLGPDEPIPDDAVRAVMAHPAWDAFGVDAILDVIPDE